MSRHERKAGGDAGDSGRVSSAWGGVTDIIISIRRGEGHTSPTVRVLQSLSRFDETPDKLVIDLQDGEYVAVGTETQVAQQHAREAILAVAPDSEAEAKRVADIVEDAEGVKTTIGKAAIAELFHEGRLQRGGSGKKNDAYRYWRVEFIESEPPVVPTESIGGASPAEDAKQPELIESLIRDGVPTQSNNNPPNAGEDGRQGQSKDPGLPSGIHSVGTPSLYTTECIFDETDNPGTGDLEPLDNPTDADVLEF